MVRLILVVVVLAAWLPGIISCDSHPAQSTAAQRGSAEAEPHAGSAGPGSQAAAPPASALEQVQHAAPAGARVEPARLSVPGLELFTVSEAAHGADDEDGPVRLVGVAGGPGGKVLDGRDLVRAAIDGKPDARTLARVALAVAEDDSEVLDGPQSRAQRKAKVSAPAIAHGALRFWLWTTDVPPQLEKATLDLATQALELEPLPVAKEVAISNAMTTLGSVRVARHVSAIQRLAALCAEPRARQALLAALAGHPRVKTRAAVADEAHRCGAAAVDALVNAMERDRSGLVRRQAAGALGRIGDARARPALAKAARGDDANLAWSANNALKKIP